MKYTFEITCQDIENTIKAELSYGTTTNNVVRAITFAAGTNEYVQDFDDLLEDMVNNLRLTVKEREDALNNIKIFKDYIMQFAIKQLNKDSKSDNKMILE